MSKTKGKPKKPDARKISKRLKLRHRKLIAHYTDPTNKETFGNGGKAAIAAGYSETSAISTASEILTNPNVQREIERIMDEAGVTGKMLTQVLRGGLKAKITRVFCPTGGNLVYSRSLADHPTRMRAAEIAFKLRGDFPATKTTVDLQGLENLGIDIIAQARKRARERLEST